MGDRYENVRIRFAYLNHFSFKTKEIQNED